MAQSWPVVHILLQVFVVHAVLHLLCELAQNPFAQSFWVSEYAQLDVSALQVELCA
jgi:hypothetical protein